MRSNITRHLGALFSHDVPHLAMARATLRATAPLAPQISLPREFSWHDYAVYLLHIAAEIEHLLMIQYLYAAYSLGGPSVPANKPAEVLGWQHAILERASPHRRLPQSRPRGFSLVRYFLSKVV